MPYVSRDAQGNINGLFTNRQTFATEFIADNDPRVVSYLAGALSGFNQDAVDRLDVIALKVAFNHENRIRVLESKAPVTMAQFKTALRGL